MTGEIERIAAEVERLNYGIRTGLPTSMAEIHRRALARSPLPPLRAHLEQDHAKD